MPGERGGMRETFQEVLTVLVPDLRGCGTLEEALNHVRVVVAACEKEGSEVALDPSVHILASQQAIVHPAQDSRGRRVSRSLT